MYLVAGETIIVKSFFIHLQFAFLFHAFIDVTN